MTLQSPAPAEASAIAVRLVDTPAGLDALRPVWEELQARDPEATIFLTWEWMAQAFRAHPYRWTVLVAEDPRHDHVGVAGEHLCDVLGRLALQIGRAHV